MPIYFSDSKELSVYFISNSLPVTNYSLEIPYNLPMKDFILLLQGNLDLLRPVLIVNGNQLPITFQLKSSSAKHIDYLENSFLFLNYSLRNQLQLTDLSSSEFLINFQSLSRFLAPLLNK